MALLLSPYKTEKSPADTSPIPTVPVEKTHSHGYLSRTSPSPLLLMPSLS